MTASRLPVLRHDDLDPDGLRVWDGVTGSRGAAMISAEGGLIGPFNAFLHAPVVGRRLSALGQAVRFETSLDRRVSELVILTVGARWKAEFEWWAHVPAAREHGVPQAVIDAIGRGAEPPLQAADERAAYAVARQLLSAGQLSQDTYDAARLAFGDAGMVELISLCGYYTLISYLLNGCAVPLPPGAEPAWTGPAGGGTPSAPQDDT
ncbi:MAG TPA: carboxymuconolactone decarboxylase family protein [Streptosporangiaceae bacterium]